MSSVYLSSEFVFPRTLEILKSELLTQVKAPALTVKYRDCGRVVPLYGPIERPDFVIDEVPY
jgi:hypothetical protein